MRSLFEAEGEMNRDKEREIEEREGELSELLKEMEIRETGISFRESKAQDKEVCPLNHKPFLVPGKGSCASPFLHMPLRVFSLFFQ